MSDTTKIEYCDHTWSPWLGCRKVSEGCENCYITSTPVFRFRGLKHGAQRVRTSESYWKQPFRWDWQAGKSGTHPRVFPSLCDPFDSEVPQSWFNDFFRLILSTGNLTWLVLTKRPENIEGRMLEFERLCGLKWDGMPDNVWLGVSAENQEQADKRIPIVLSIPAKVRWVSVEPMLGPVDLELYLGWKAEREAKRLRSEVLRNALKSLSDTPGVDWVVVGGESGFNHRKLDLAWVRSVVNQCKEAGVACFVKQASHRVPGQQGSIPDDLWQTKQYPVWAIKQFPSL